MPTIENSDFSEEPSNNLEIKLEGNDWQLPTDLAILEKVRNEIEQRLQAVGWNEKDINAVLTACDEAITNAMVHGNLEVPGLAELGNDDKEFKRLKKLAMKTELVNRKVYINFELSDKELIITVRDEGRGVPVDKIPNPTEEKNKMKEGGRGIFLMRMLCNKVEFEGTEVKMYKTKSV